MGHEASLHTLCIHPTCPNSAQKRHEMSEKETVLTIAQLSERVDAILRHAGLNAAQAGALARVLVAGERDACKSHGVYRIEGILRTVKAGKVNPQAVPELMPDQAPPSSR